MKIHSLTFDQSFSNNECNISFLMSEQSVSYSYSCDIGSDVSLKVGVRLCSSLQGRYMVSMVLVSDGVVLDVSSVCPIKPGEEEMVIGSVTTSNQTSFSSTGQTLRIRDLTFASSVLVYVWRVDSTEEHLIGRVTFPLFSDSGVLMQGRRAVFINRSSFEQQAESSLFIDTLTSEKSHWKLPHDWLVSSNLMVKDDEALCDLLRNEGTNVIDDEGLSQDDRFLFISLPVVAGGLPVLFSEGRMRSQTSNLSYRRRGFEPIDDEVTAQEKTSVHWLLTNGLPIKRTTYSVPTALLTSKPSVFLESPRLVDYDAFREHPAVLKVARLTRKSTVRLGSKPLGQPPRPSAEELRRITDVISQPFRVLSVDEKSLLLHFAWSFTDRKAGLVKVLQVVDWSDPTETLTALSIMEAWSAPEIEDALSLLGRDFAVCPAGVRDFAVRRLAASATFEELRLYLLQLVQTLRFDGSEGSLVSEWPLAGFLVYKACKDPALATQLFWYIQAEEKDDEKGGVFTKAGHYFWLELGKTSTGINIRRELEAQCSFRRRLSEMAIDVKSRKSDKKNERLRALLKGDTTLSVSEPAVSLGLNVSRPEDIETADLTVEFARKLALPLDPTVSVLKVEPSLSFCARSALSPIVLACEIEQLDESGSLRREIRRYMYKAGDDLRQDQLIIQLISLMDTLFKRYGLDLKLTPYKVLATSKEDGFIEFVQDSQSLSSLLASHGDNLLDFFRSVKPSASGFCGVDPKVLDTFSRSCAGYCVITYVLGVGDRHLDNLLLTADGRLFHVDFGYILGRDPKPFPPPMKLCKEMVDGMGGANSPFYKNFVSKCCQGYSILRRHAKLLISLLRLAADADIKDMREQDPEVVILKVQQKLQPEATDAKAEQDFIALINESTNALFPVVIEKLHKWALYWR